MCPGCICCYKRLLSDINVLDDKYQLHLYSIASICEEIFSYACTVQCQFFRSIVCLSLA